jgi:hypothetical protein
VAQFPAHLQVAGLTVERLAGVTVVRHLRQTNPTAYAASILPRRIPLELVLPTTLPLVVALALPFVLPI